MQGENSAPAARGEASCRARGEAASEAVGRHNKIEKVRSDAVESLLAQRSLAQSYLCDFLCHYHALPAAFAFGEGRKSTISLR